MLYHGNFVGINFVVNALNIFLLTLILEWAYLFGNGGISPE
jgi:hypothetical protein